MHDEESRDQRSEADTLPPPPSVETDIYVTVGNSSEDTAKFYKLFSDSSREVYFVLDRHGRARSCLTNISAAKAALDASGDDYVAVREDGTIMAKLLEMTEHRARDIVIAWQLGMELCPDTDV